MGLERRESDDDDDGGEIENPNEKEKGFYIDLLSFIFWVIFGNILLFLFLGVLLFIFN